MPGMVPGLCRSLCFVHHLLPCTVPIDTQHQCSIRSSIYRFGCEFEASTVPATPWLEGAATWFYKMTTRSNTHTLSIYYIYGMDTLGPWPRTCTQRQSLQSCILSCRRPDAPAITYIELN